MTITINGDGTITGLNAGGLPDNSITLANMAHGTDGQIITYDASGAPVALGPGTDGQLLTSTGAGSPPAFETLSASKWTQRAAESIGTGSSFTFSSIPSTAALIIVTYHNISGHATNADNFVMRCGAGSDPGGTAGENRGLSAYMQDNDTGEVNAGDDAIPLGPYAFTAHDGYYHGHMILTKWDTGKFHANGSCFHSSATLTSAPATYAITLTGEVYLSSALDRIRLMFHNGTGNFDDGDVAIAYMEP